MPRQYTFYVPLPCEHCGRPRPRDAKRFCGRACWQAVMRPPSDVRFWTRVNKTPTDWLWTGEPDVHGYGRIDHEERSYKAHVFAYMLASGAPIPEGFIVCHTCDIPACVRNDEAGVYTVKGVEYRRFGHLFLGTDAANAADMVTKGRHPSTAHPELRARGTQHHNAKMTEETVLAMRADYATRRGTQMQLAARYGVSQPVVSKILRRETWQHI